VERMSIDDADARERAIEALKSKRAFQTQVVSYVVVNIFLWALWLLTKGDGNAGFWPAWVTLGWGIGLAFSAWHAYGEKPITEEDIQRELRRQQGRTGS
jgi:fatty acid desaturase